MKNYALEFMKDNDLEMGDRFFIITNDGDKLPENFYFKRDSINENLISLLYKSTSDDYQDFEYDADDQLYALLCGFYSIEKIQFMPKRGSFYYCVLPNGMVTKRWFSYNDLYDYNNVLTENCYETEEKAIKNINKHMEKFKSEVENNL